MTSGFVLSLLFLVGNLILSLTAAPVGNGEKPVRPHNFRFLIQAVASDGPGFFKTFHLEAVQKGTESQAAGSLVKKDGTPIVELFGKVQVIAKTGTESTRQYLQMLSNAFRADDLRRAADMSEAWGASIVKEIGVILSGVMESETYHGKSHGYASTLHAAAGKPNDDKRKPKYEAHLWAHSTENKFKSEKDKHTLAFMAADTGNHAKHVLAHDLEGWNRIVTHHNSAKEALGSLSKILFEIHQGMGNLIKEHFTSIFDKIPMELKWDVQLTGFYEKHLEPAKKLEPAKESESAKELEPAKEFPGRAEQIMDSVLKSVNAIVPTVFPELGNPVDKFSLTSEEFGKLLSEQSVISAEADPAETKPPQDSFDVRGAFKLGFDITDWIATVPIPGAEEKKNPDTSPAETMDRLSSTLNALKIRKSALSDAETSLTHLLSQIGKEMGTNSDALGGKLKEMISLLNGVDQLGRVVYKDAALYPEQYGVEIDYDGNADLYTTYQEEVRTARAQDAIAEIHPRLNLLLNVAHRVHGHMLAFVRAVSNEDTSPDELIKDIATQRTTFNLKAVNQGSIDSALANSDGSEQLGSQGVFTGINELSAAVKGSSENLVKSYTAPEDAVTERGSDQKDAKDKEKNAARSELSLNLKKMLFNARVASECLLYGRYDVLMVKFKRNFLGLSDKASSETDSQDKKEHEAEAAWCGTTHAWGIKELRSSVIDHFTILGLDSNADADAVGKAVAAKKKRYEEKQQKALKETDNLTPNRYPRILDQITAAERELAAEEIADYKGKLDSHINAIAERIKNLATATSDGPAA